MGLKKNELQILNLILENKSLEEISLELGTSERNLRYLIDNLNFYLKKILRKTIEKDKKKLIFFLSSEELEKFLENVYKNHYVPDQKERVEYILLAFLFLQDIKLSFLEKSLEITRGTLKKDIRLLNLILTNYDLKLESNKNKFVLIGNEKKLRHLKTLKYLEYQNKKHWINKNDIFKEIYILELKKLRPFILEIEKKFFIDFGDEFFNLMEVFLFISLNRIAKNQIIDRKVNYEFLIETKHYLIIQNVLKEFIPKNLTYELAHLTEYFISGGVKENLKELYESVEKYIQGLLFFIFQEFSYTDLKLRLIEYLISAVYRLKNNFSLGQIGVKSEIYYLVEEYSSNDFFLPEKLTEKEIFYLAKEIEKEKIKVISLKKLIEIIEESTGDLNKKKLCEDLILIYGNFIKIDV